MKNNTGETPADANLTNIEKSGLQLTSADAILANIEKSGIQLTSADANLTHSSTKATLIFSADANPGEPLHLYARNGIICGSGHHLHDFLLKLLYQVSLYKYVGDWNVSLPFCDKHELLLLLVIGLLFLY